MHNAVVLVVFAFVFAVIVVFVVTVIVSKYLMPCWPYPNYFHPICVVCSSAFRRHLLLGGLQAGGSG
jgi:hypothetical protein